MRAKDERGSSGKNGAGQETPSGGRDLRTAALHRRHLERRGKGRELPDGVRGKFERSTGADLSGVRVHEGADSAADAKSLDARAFTEGQDIHFADGESAATPADEALLAHEVAHTVQQSRGGGEATQRKGRGSEPGNPAESEADQAADAMVSGEHAQISPGGGAHAAPPQAGAETVTLGGQGGFGPFEAHTFSELAQLTELAVTRLQMSQSDPAPPGTHERAQAWIAAEHAEAPAIQQRGEAPLTAEAAVRARTRFHEFEAIWAALNQAPTGAANPAEGAQAPVGHAAGAAGAPPPAEGGMGADGLREAASRLSDGADQARGAEPELQENLREKFQSGDTTAIQDASALLANMSDVGLAMSELSHELSEAIPELLEMGHAGGEGAGAAGAGHSLGGAITSAEHTLVRNHPLSEETSIVGQAERELAAPRELPWGRWMNNMNRILATWNLVVNYQNPGGAPNEFGAAEARLNNLMGEIGVGGAMAGGTALSLASHIGIYMDMYLAPMVAAVMHNLTRVLGRHLHEVNTVATQSDGIFPIDATNEPGGVPMYHYMVQVMHDGDGGELPPPPEEVREYLFENREALEAGTGEELPIHGVRGFRSVDPQRVRAFIATHRDDIWAKLYGSWPVPERPGEGNESR